MRGDRSPWRVNVRGQRLGMEASLRRGEPSPARHARNTARAPARAAPGNAGRPPAPASGIPGNHWAGGGWTTVPLCHCAGACTHVNAGACPRPYRWVPGVLSVASSGASGVPTCPAPVAWAGASVGAPFLEEVSIEPTPLSRVAGLCSFSPDQHALLHDLVACALSSICV